MFVHNVDTLWTNFLKDRLFAALGREKARSVCKVTDFVDRHELGGTVLSREDFIFTIGYDGPVAVIDNQAKRKYGKFSTRELAEKGLFRAAYSSAVYSKDPQELKLVAETYNKLSGYSSVESTAVEFTAGDSSETNLTEAALTTLNRLFGVFPVDVKRSISL